MAVDIVYYITPKKENTAKENILEKLKKMQNIKIEKRGEITSHQKDPIDNVT